MNKKKENSLETAVNVKKIKLDDLDNGILEELKANCKQTWRELAKKLGVSPVTIMNRTKALEKNGVINGYTARVDYNKMGFELLGLVGITAPGTVYEKIAEDLIRLPEIDSAYATTGDYDIIAVFRAKDKDDFYRTVQKLYRMAEIHTKTYFAVALKEGYFPIPGAQEFKL